MTGELTALLAAETGQVKAVVSPLNNELDFRMQPKDKSCIRAGESE